MVSLSTNETYPVIQPSGDIEYIQPEGSEGRPTLRQLQDAVGGYIEAVPLADWPHRYMYVNEEGLIHGLPLNLIASKFAGQPIMGPAILMPEGSESH